MQSAYLATAKPDFFVLGMSICQWFTDRRDQTWTNLTSTLYVRPALRNQKEGLRYDETGNRRQSTGF